MPRKVGTRGLQMYFGMRLLQGQAGPRDWVRAQALEGKKALKRKATARKPFPQLPQASKKKAVTYFWERRKGPQREAVIGPKT